MTAGTTSLPTGTVTFLLTDIQGSTEAWQAAPDEMTSHVTLHYEILDRAISAHGGHRPEEQGEGDSVVAVFDDAAHAARAAIQAQRELQSRLPDLPVRMALHTGEAMLRDKNNYVGLTIIRCARIRNCGHGGQILLSDETRREVAKAAASDVQLIDLGVYGLRGLSGRSRIWQLNHPELPATFPPLNAGASASIAWTYEKLDPVEQQLLCRLSIFCGGFEPDAATRVGAGDGVSESTAMQSVGKLMDQHLLETVGSNRVAMSSAMRSYCRERLDESDDRLGATLRHADWCAHIADVFGGDQADSALADLEADAADIVAAIERATRFPRPEVAYRIIIGIGRHWAGLHNPALVRDLARWITTRTPSDGELFWSSAVARLSYALRGDVHAIHDYCDEAQAIAEMVGDQVTQRYFDRDGSETATTETVTAETVTTETVTAERGETVTTETGETGETVVVDMAKTT